MPSSSTPKQGLKPGPKPPASFLVCGHQCPPEARPMVSNGGVKFNESAGLYSEPAMCLTCSITHTKNRQQTIIDTYQSRIDVKLEDILDRAMRVSHEQDRTEILETGKRTAMADIIPERNVEIVELWQGFAKIWDLAERVASKPPSPPIKNGPNRNTPNHNDPNKNNGSRSAASPAPATDKLSIGIDRTNGHLAVVLTWRNKSHDVVEKSKIMSL